MELVWCQYTDCKSIQDQDNSRKLNWKTIDRFQRISRSVKSRLVYESFVFDKEHLEQAGNAFSKAEKMHMKNCWDRSLRYI